MPDRVASGWTIRLYEDRLEANASAGVLPPAIRAIYVRAGGAGVAGESVNEDNAIFVAGPLTATAGPDGATLWRWEVVPDGAGEALLPGAETRPNGRYAITTLDPGDGAAWLLRCDSVWFPPGGQALTHVHQGPGIRCLQHGTLDVETAGEKHRVKPGESWFESGPDPVFAQADANMPTRFIRTFVLPRALLGQSSIRYVKPEDQDKPKTQKYQVYVDVPITLGPR